MLMKLFPFCAVIYCVYKYITMIQKSFLKASLAELYIVLLVSVMQYVQRVVPESKTILIPIAMLSLFVLSAAVMGYLFVSEPVMLCIDGKKEEAMRLFLSTVGVFAAITALAFLALFSGAFS